LAGNIKESFVPAEFQYSTLNTLFSLSAFTKMRNLFLTLTAIALYGTVVTAQSPCDMLDVQWAELNCAQWIRAGSGGNFVECEYIYQQAVSLMLHNKTR
jgi:hypothetical protein